MGLFSRLMGHDAELDERLAGIVRDYLAKHGVTVDRWTNVKGEPPKRIYAGIGSRDGREVGFFVNLDTGNYPDTVGVVIPKKTGLSTYAHHWRKLWSIDHRPEHDRPPLFDYMLQQMPGAYEPLEPPPAPPRPTNEQFEAQVYEAIQKKTGLNYREILKRVLSPKSQKNVQMEILQQAGSGGDFNGVVDLIIRVHGESIKLHIEALTTLPQYLEKYYEPKYLLINRIVFENTGLNYLTFYNASEDRQSQKLVDDDQERGVAPAITAGKVIERFKAHVAAYFMVLTGAADRAIVRDGEIFATEPSKK